MSRRHAVSVEVANLTDVERQLLDLTIAVLSDPALIDSKQAVLEGRLAMKVEGDEVVWIDPQELETKAGYVLTEDRR